jgi:uncharacterized protein
VSNVERRFTPVAVELRADTPESRSIGGYAAKFNRLSKDLGGFVERIDPGFFNTSRGEGWPDVIARYNHDDNMLLGTTAGGTLRLSIDETGLMYEVPDVPQARNDVLELVQRGDVSKSSFAFYTAADDWDMTERDYPQRTLLDGKLVDVAPVNTPAYDDTSSGLRSLARKMHATEEEVRKLAEAKELGKFFVRTDVAAPATVLGPNARALIMARRAPVA